MTVSRARGKLEAALAQFGLRGRVDGARAIDVGASTGGFTEALLASGAAQVLAVDVGHGQLHPSLRGDPRVVSLEGVDWKRLSLDVAEGPFDFFTVDVSFVAARNMLRGLAFRLRAGAEGVVLVKPQFELPDRPGQGRYVDDADRRREALEKVRRKAETLGFSLVAHADSPVTGAGGTVEALAHLRFAGRPERLPRPGERRRDAIGAPAPRGRPAPGASPHADPPLRWFAVVSPGLEEVTLREVAALPGITGVEQVPGGVEWTGPAASGYRANLWLRVATRVLARVGAVDAREFGQLRRRAAKLPWRTFVADGSVIAVRASASRCRLYHTGGLAENVALAIADAVPAPGSPRPSNRKGTRTGKRKGTRTGERKRRKRRRLSRSSSGAARIASRSASTRRASGSTGAAPASRSGAAPLRETLAGGPARAGGLAADGGAGRSDVRRGDDRDRGRRRRRWASRPGSPGGSRWRAGRSARRPRARRRWPPSARRRRRPLTSPRTSPSPCP